MSLLAKAATLTPSVELHQFSITLTSPSGFTSVQETLIARWHVSHSESCYLVSELHASGLKHYHSVIACVSPAAAGKVSVNLGRLYASMDLDHKAGLTTKVNKIRDLIGWFAYMRKDQKEKAPILLMGWKMSWIKQQCIDNVKKMKNTHFQKGKFIISKVTACDVIFEYAKAAAIPLTNKEAYFRLIPEMIRQGYRFIGLRHANIYGHIAALLGDDRPMISVLEYECLNI